MPAAFSDHYEDKYLRKIPTGKTSKTGKPLYRYLYRVGTAGGLGHAGEIKVGAAFAVTLSDPTDYQTYQIKARLAEFGDADADDVNLADSYVRRMTQTLLELGVTAQQLACWLLPRDLVRLRLIPMAMVYHADDKRVAAAQLAQFSLDKIRSTYKGPADARMAAGKVAHDTMLRR